MDHAVAGDVAQIVGKVAGCATGGCNKLNTYDWLGNMRFPPDKTEVDNIYEIRF
ncbi:MAG: hypothetical protein R3B47_00520 [Bacteroidia bacterium]